MIVSETSEEEGDVLQPPHQLHASEREDIRVGQCEELPEFSESSSDKEAHLDVPQYRTGADCYNHMTFLYLSCLFFKRRVTTAYAMNNYCCFRRVRGRQYFLTLCERPMGIKYTE